MKFDEQLAAYLYENKTLRLEGIGTFNLADNASVPTGQERDTFYPIEGLTFLFNPKTETDEDLIIFLVKKLHKIQPLIRSDLESYLSNIKQFINLGKPYTIEGIGTLAKNNSGIYEFTPGNFIPVRENLQTVKEHADIAYAEPKKSPAGKVAVIILVIVASLAALGGLGWLVSNFITQHNNVPVEEQQVGYTDTLSAQTSDTPAMAAPTPAATPVNSFSEAERRGEPVEYHMIHEVTTSRQRAVARTSQLRSYNTNSRFDSVNINNNTLYQMYIPMTIRPTDTARVKDSLRVFLGKKIVIKRP